MRFPNLLNVLVFVIPVSIVAGVVVLALKGRWLDYCDRLHVPEGHLFRRRLWPVLVTFALTLGAGVSTLLVMLLQGAGGNPPLSPNGLHLGTCAAHPAFLAMGSFRGMSADSDQGSDFLGYRRWMNEKAEVKGADGKGSLDIRWVRLGWTGKWELETAVLTTAAGQRIDLLQKASP